LRKYLLFFVLKAKRSIKKLTFYDTHFGVEIIFIKKMQKLVYEEIFSARYSFKLNNFLQFGATYFAYFSTYSLLISMT